MKVFTIGFTKKSAEKFFSLLLDNDVKTLIDIRLNNKSQLAGFAKGTDLEYFLKTICNIKYKHYIKLAPSKTLLTDYKNKDVTWNQYETIYINELRSSNFLDVLNVDELEHACFLCSEDLPNQCHRRLLVDELSKYYEFEISHLK